MNIHSACKLIAARRCRLLVVCCLAAVVSGCSGRQDAASEKKATPPTLNVNVVRIVRNENVFDSKTYFGTVKPRRSSQLGFARGGRVKSVSKGVGDIVAKDEEIAALDQSQLDENLAQVSEEIQESERKLAALPQNAGNQQTAPLKQEIAKLKRQREGILLELENGKILAPYKGVIATRNVHEGDAVPVGRPVFRIIDDAAPDVEVDVALKLADQIKKGRLVWVLKGGAAIEAKLVTKAPEVNSSDRTQTLTLSVVPKAASVKWKYGEVVEVRFWIQTKRSGFWLPYSTLQRQAGGLWSAYVVEGEGKQQVVARRTVELLQIYEDLVLVGGSLKEGDRLIVDGSNRVVPGQLVVAKQVDRKFSAPGPPGTSE